MVSTNNPSTILRKRYRHRTHLSAARTLRTTAFGRSSARLALVVLAVAFAVPTLWPTGRVFSHSSAVVAVEEGVSLFADAAGSTPKTVFNLGDKVWAIENGAPGPFLGNRQRRFQWVAPDGTVKQQADIIAFDSQSDSYQLSTTAQVGTWKVKTIDNSNAGFATADFVVKDPVNAAVDLSVGVFSAAQVAAGNDIAYTLQVKNNGPDDALQVEIADQVPDGASFKSMTPENGWECTGGALPCSIASLPIGVTAVFTVIYSVGDTVPAGTIISNTVSASSNTSELHSPDNTSTKEATVTGASTCNISCPQNITQAHDPGMNGAVVNYTTPAVTDCPCDPAQPEDCFVTASPASGSLFPAGVTSVVATSLKGGSCSFTVTVTGAVTITLDGPDPMTVECHGEFIEPGVTAQNDSGGTVLVTSSVGSTVDLNTPGTYPITYTATENGFTATATRTVVVVDTTPPVITLNGANPMVVALGSTFTDPGATALDACSPGAKPVTATGTVDTSTSGIYKITYTTTDGTNEGTAERTVIVPYAFTGFLPPISNFPEVNVVNAGKAIPVKFSLGGFKGLDIFAPGYPIVAQLNCPDSQGNDVEQTVTAGESTLSYDANTDQYIYVWKTEKVWEGSCRQLVIKLNDDTVHIANFRFK